MDELPLNDVLPLHADRPPLRVDDGGVVRVGNTMLSFQWTTIDEASTQQDLRRPSDP